MFFPKEGTKGHLFEMQTSANNSCQNHRKEKKSYLETKENLKIFSIIASAERE